MPRLGLEEHPLSKLEACLNSKSHLKNDNEHFSPLRLSPGWLAGFVEALLKHGGIQDTVFNLRQVGPNHGACLNTSCLYHLCYG